MSESKLRITEVFYSLQGEASTVGHPTIFIRLTGCPLRCQYCDTAYAFNGGSLISINDILSEIKKYNTKYITVTGGEPLAQPNCLDLLTALCDLDYVVSLETSGALSLQDVDSRVIKVMDLKTPGSAECEKNDWNNLQWLSKQDQVKFVICNQEDYLWSKQIVEEHSLNYKCDVLFSASNDELPATELADWILEDQLPIRFQLQLHKILWGNQAGK